LQFSVIPLVRRAQQNPGLSKTSRYRVDDPESRSHRRHGLAESGKAPRNADLHDTQNNAVERNTGRHHHGFTEFNKAPTYEDLNVTQNPAVEHNAGRRHHAFAEFSKALTHADLADAPIPRVEHNTTSIRHIAGAPLAQVFYSISALRSDVAMSTSDSSSSNSSGGAGNDSNSDEEEQVEEEQVEEVPEVWTENEGESTYCDEEVAADAALRGQAALVTASCPRRYPKDLEARKAKKIMLPEDYTKDEFLNNFRRVFDAHSTQRIEKATCHNEPHKRFHPSGGRRERHKHIAFKATNTFAHKKIADIFYRQHGVRINFSFKLNRFVGYLKYLMEPGKKASTDLDTNPAKYPPNLDLAAELAVKGHPGATSTQEGGKKRKRLTFDEVSNVIIEGVGEGPIYSVEGLEMAARSLKQEGKVELWNYLGELKTVADSRALVARVWRLQGTVLHPLWHKIAAYPMSAFTMKDLPGASEWLAGKHKTHALVLSGD